MKKITLIAALFAAATMSAQVFTEDFEGETVDATTFTNWDSVDQDGDGEFWEVADIAAFAAVNAPAHPMQSLAADSDSWEGTPFSPDNFLITSSTIDLSAATDASVTYTVGTYQTNGTFVADQYSVYMSTSNDPADIVNETPLTTRTVGDDAPSDQADGSASAATVTIDASAYAGEVVYLTFRHYNTTDENSVLIDDISVDASLSVGDEAFNDFVYFVDVNNQLNLRANSAIQNIVLHNVLGQQVINKALSSNTETISLASLNSGVYLATVTIDGANKTFKVVRK